jgi:hypothetical protein
MTTFRDRLQSAWEMRNAGDLSAAFAFQQAAFAELGLAYQAPAAANSARLAASGVSAQDSVEFLLLEVSFLRNQRRVERACSLLEEIRAAYPAECTRNPLFHLQAGLNSLVASRDHEALQSFLQAKTLSTQPRQRLVAWFNALLCMENLAMDTERELSAFAEQFVPFAGEPWTVAIHAQLDAFRLRDAFRHGDTVRLASMIRDDARSDQALYLAAWLACLPTLELGTGEDRARTLYHSRITQKVSPMGLPWLAQYRQRTLDGMLVDADLRDEIKLHDSIERLYLWVWRWLKKPEVGSLRKILHLCASIRARLSELERRIESIPPETRQMLELAVRWIGLMGGVRDLELIHSFKSLPSAADTAVPQLDYERLLIDYAFSLRDRLPTAEDTRAALESHPARAIEGFALPKLLDPSADAAGLGILVQTIRAFGQDELPGEGIVAEILQKRIRVIRPSRHPRHGARSRCETILSAPLAELVHLFASRSSATRAEVLGACFGIHRYDSVYHDPKLANLLTQANREFKPYLDFKTKGAHVFCERQDGKVLILENGPHELCFVREESLHEKLGLSVARAAPATQSDRQPSAPSEAGRHPAEIDPGSLTRRQDFEAALGMSRATAVRWLNRCESKGLILKHGSGKSTEYQANPDRIQDLKRELARTQRRMP